jgi:hypothetical protein
MNFEAYPGENKSAEIQLLTPQQAYTESDRIVEFWSCYPPADGNYSDFGVLATRLWISSSRR